MIEKRGRRDTLACGTDGQTGRHSDGVSKVLLCKDILWFLAYGLVLIGGLLGKKKYLYNKHSTPQGKAFLSSW